MAVTHFPKGSCVLIAMALLLAAAIDASAQNYNPTTTTTTPTTTSAAKSDPNNKPAYHNGYVSMLELEKLKSKMRQYKEQGAEQHRPKLGNGYGSKSQLEPRTSGFKQAEKPKVVSYEKRFNYGSYRPKPKVGYANGVEGVVSCKSGSGYYPLQGAVVKITCPGEAKESLCSTDGRGYFYKTLSYGKPEQCKAFLVKSPSEKCSVPTNVNKGINGARLSSYRILHDKRVKLYPLGPFFYSSPYGQQNQLNAKQQQVTKSPAGY